MAHSAVGKRSFTSSIHSNGLTSVGMRQIDWPLSYHLQVLPMEFYLWWRGWSALAINRLFSQNPRKKAHFEFFVYFNSFKKKGFELHACFGGGIIFRHGYLSKTWSEAVKIILKIFKANFSLPAWAWCYYGEGQFSQAFPFPIPRENCRA